MRTTNACSEPVGLCCEQVDDDPGTVKLRPARAAATENDELVGRRLGGYVVERVVGKGGMGVVYLATHPVLGKRVAVKVIRSEHAADDELRRRFMDEARTLAALDDPRIVAIQDLALLPDGRAYLVMEYVEGELLSQRMGTRSPVDEAVRIVRAMLEGLAAAHTRGIVHRDVKPSNIMLVGDGVKLLDFGIAKLRGQSGAGTRAGAVVGTPGYMAPEQASAKAELGPTADVYAAGVVLYELLAGKRPFDDGSDGEDWIEVLVRQRTLEPPSMVGVPSWLEAVVRLALAKDPARRYASAAEMLAALDARTSVRRRGAHAWAPYAIGAAAVATAIFVTWQLASRARSDAPPTPDSATTHAAVALAPADAAAVIAPATSDAPTPELDAPSVRREPPIVVVHPTDAGAGVARPDVAAAASVARPDAGAVAEGAAANGRFELPAPAEIHHIDVTAWIATARQLARRIYPDAELFNVFASHVMTDGTADIHDNGFVQYEFRSPSESTKDSGRCTLHVTIYYYGIRVGVYDNVWKCDQMLYTPLCSLKQVIARAPDFADASVQLRTHRGAAWNLEHHGKKTKVPDDCGAP
jgi:tRNA A-37 threonylcarbamoyl transferase component Bud32